ncbi:MAG: right-handed parallel beta-helix repeat-containing protein [Promethearchaeota archaeon]|nr:MAG: right-handed parallel beta-helix repeat-containing protein [Candidatus Lokiarchaeota archaeon]
MTKKKQIFNLLIVFFIILIIGYLGENLATNYAETVEDKTQKNLRNSGYWVLDFIHVKGNWTQTNSTFDWCSGSGTEIDPYLIENVVIDGQNSSSCIIIENTREYFEIKNCTLYNAGAEQIPEYDCGIRIENCSNGKLINNNISFNNFIGMYLDDCNNTVIQGNNVSHNEWSAIYLLFCQDCKIVGNNVYNNSREGAYLTRSDYLTVLDNTFINNSESGVSSYQSDHCYFKNNTASFNLESGFQLLSIFNNTVINNTINNNGAHGLLLNDANNCTIIRNIANNNTGTMAAGIFLGNGNYNSFLGNIAEFNYWAGIFFQGTCLFNNVTRNNLTYSGVTGLYFWGAFGPIEQNIISGNNITNPGEEGIQLAVCQFNTVVGNNIDDNNYGVLLNSCNNTSISGNTIKNSFNNGIYLVNFNENNTISGNVIVNQSWGIRIINRNKNNKIINNNISESRSSGIHVDFLNDLNIISGNIIDNSDEDGIYLSDECTKNVISGNTIDNNSLNGILLEDECNNNTIMGNTIKSNDNNGISLDNNCYNNTIIGNNIYNNSNFGLYLDDHCERNEISGNNQIWNNSNGIFLYTCDHTIINNNDIYNNSGYIAWMQYNNYTTFCNNNIYENDLYMYIHSCYFSNYSDNIIINNADHGLYLLSCENNTISGNTITNNEKNGIYLRNSINHTITGNIIKYNDEKGIYVENSNNTSLTGNIITDNGENGIYLLTSNYNNITGNYLICYLECILEDTCVGNIIENNEYYVNLTSIPVFIDGNSQWSSIASSEFWCSGSGTFNDPYVISHVYINGQDSGSCILIQNTTAYFTIEESIIFNSGSGNYDAGIKFINVTNGNIINNNCSLNLGSGIILLYCSNMTILNNIMENNPNSYGCWLIWSDNNNLTGNTAYNNNIGIGLNYSNFNDIIGNFLDFNSYGVTLGHSNNNTIMGNTLNNNSLHGIFLYFSDYNFISGNIINGNEHYGVYLFSSDYNTISFNTFIFNVEGIVENGTSTGNVFEDNDIVNRDSDGDGLPVQPDNLIFIIIAAAGISVGVMGTIIYTQYRRIKRRKRTDWVKLKKKKGLISPELIEVKNLIFISYATKDSDLFQIPLINEVLTAYPEIENVLYWESDMHDDIYEYMDDNLQLCKVFLLFCSQTSLVSDAVKMEWRSALKLDKKIIPIFINPEDIPPLLTTKLGVQFDTSEAYDSIENIYQMILKKLEIPSTRQYCDYIVPKTISKDIFDQKIQIMKTKELYFENDMLLDQVERELSSILQKNNFHIVEKELDPINSELKGIKGFAEGKYDKQEIGLIITVQKVSEGNNLIKIIAMSNKEWIAVEILKDINVKSNILKSTNVLLREYSEKIEAVMEKIADLEEFLTKNLGSELDKLREVLNKYNRAEISRSELIKSGADLIGKSFLTAFIKKYFSEEIDQQRKE